MRIDLIHRSKGALCAVLAAITILAYWHITTHQFINYDDQDYLTNNTEVQGGLSWAAIRWAFRTDYAGNWHPLTWISHMIDCQLFGMHAGGHHLTSLLLHTANTVILFLLLDRMTRATGRSALVAALFGLHPLHVESVAWASERKDVLSACFFLLTLLAYSSYAARVERPATPGAIQSSEPRSTPASKWGFYVLSLILFVCGLMSKPMLVTLPFILVMLDFWPLQRWAPPEAGPGSSTARMIRLLAEKAPFFLLSVISSIVTFLVQRKTGTVSSVDLLPLDVRIENALVSYLLYLVKLVWPVGLAPFYPYVMERPIALLGVSAVFLLATTSAVLALLKRAPYLAVGWFWYAGMLVPVIGLVQVGIQAMADRYTYLPSIGIFLAVIWGVAEWVRRSEPRRLFSTAAAAVALSGCFVLTAMQVPRWRDSKTLFRHTLKVTSENPVAHHCLGCVLVEQGKVEEAEKHFAEAVRLRPRNYEARNNLGLALVIRGRYDEAIEQYNTVLLGRPNAEKTHYNLGRALEAQGHREEAIAHYRRTLEIQPRFTDARAALAEALEQLGLLQARTGGVAEAVTHFREVLRLRPDGQAYYNLALAQVMAGDTREAVEAYRKALELNPDWPEALNDLAWIRATAADPALRNGPEAVKLAERACGLTHRRQARFLGTLDAAYAESGDFQRATETVEETLRVALAADSSEVAAAARRRQDLYRTKTAFHLTN